MLGVWVDTSVGAVSRAERSLNAQRGVASELKIVVQLIMIT